MPRESISSQTPVPAHVLAELKALEQQVIQGGNVDSERDTFHHIMEELKLHHMSPDEALIAAHSLVESRQQYH